MSALCLLLIVILFCPASQKQNRRNRYHRDYAAPMAQQKIHAFLLFSFRLCARITAAATLSGRRLFKIGVRVNPGLKVSHLSFNRLDVNTVQIIHHFYIPVKHIVGGGEIKIIRSHPHGQCCAG